MYIANVLMKSKRAYRRIVNEHIQQPYGASMEEAKIP